MKKASTFLRKFKYFSSKSIYIYILPIKQFFVKYFCLIYKRPMWSENGQVGAAMRCNKPFFIFLFSFLNFRSGHKYGQQNRKPFIY